MLLSGFRKHLFEADVFRFGEPEIVSVDLGIHSGRATGLPSSDKYRDQVSVWDLSGIFFG